MTTDTLTEQQQQGAVMCTLADNVHLCDLVELHYENARINLQLGNNKATFKCRTCTRLIMVRGVPHLEYIISHIQDRHTLFNIRVDDHCSADIVVNDG